MVISGQRQQAEKVDLSLWVQSWTMPNRLIAKKSTCHPQLSSPGTLKMITNSAVLQETGLLLSMLLLAPKIINLAWRPNDDLQLIK